MRGKSLQGLNEKITNGRPSRRPFAKKPHHPRPRFALASRRLGRRVEAYESPRVDRAIPHGVERDSRGGDQTIGLVRANDGGGLLETRKHSLGLEDQLLR